MSNSPTGSGDFRLLSRRAVDACSSLPENNRFSKGLFSWIGFDTVSFTYRNVARAAGETKWGAGALLNYGIDGLLSFNSRPLRLAIHAGLVARLVRRSSTRCGSSARPSSAASTAPGYVTLVAAIVGLGGIQLVMLGSSASTSGGSTTRPSGGRTSWSRRATPRARHACHRRPARRPRSGGGRHPRPAGRLMRALPTPGRRCQIVRFAAVGGVNTLTFSACYLPLHRLLPYFAAYTAAFVTSMVGSSS